MHVFGHCGGDDLLWGEPDALVDDLETGIAGSDGHLLGAVAVSVEPGFADKQTKPGPQLFTSGANPLAQLRQLTTHRSIAHPDGSGNPCRRSIFAEDVAQCLGPLTRGDAGARRFQRRRHQVGARPRVFPQSSEC